MGGTARSRWDVRAWMLYDWANSAFATTVLAAFFPMFFKKYWAADMAPGRSTALLGTAASASVLLVLVVAVVLGPYADRTGRRRLMLAIMAAVGAASTFGLSLVPRGEPVLALALYVLGMLGFAGGNVFYDALLPIVAPPGRLDDVSAKGFATGYAGGGLLFALQVAMVAAPDRFGLADQASAVRLSFALTGAWWAVFAVPVLLVVREPRSSPGRDEGEGGGSGRVLATVRRLTTHRDLFLFLVAFWFFGDGIGTVQKMSAAFATDIGLEAGDVSGALLMVQFIGIPAAWLYGRLARRAGRRPMILAGIAAYTGVVVFACFMTSGAHYYVLAAVVGLFQGGIQAVSRSLFASMTPKERSGEFFGFYNLTAKMGTMLGPLLVGWTADLTGNPRMGILGLIVVFVVGAAVLAIVDPARGEARAGQA